jgi:hypothetical protein
MRLDGCGSDWWGRCWRSTAGGRIGSCSSGVDGERRLKRELSRSRAGQRSREGVRRDARRADRLRVCGHSSRRGVQDAPQRGRLPGARQESVHARLPTRRWIGSQCSESVSRARRLPAKARRHPGFVCVCLQSGSTNEIMVSGVLDGRSLLRPSKSAAVRFVGSEALRLATRRTPSRRSGCAPSEGRQRCASGCRPDRRRRGRCAWMAAGAAGRGDAGA